LYALNPGVAMPCFAAWALWFLGQPDQALEVIKDAVRLARELAEPQGLAHAHTFAAFLYHFRRDVQLTRENAEIVIALSHEHGLVMYEGMANVVHGWALNEQESGREAIQQMREGLAALAFTGTNLVRPHFLALLAQALIKVNETDEALA